MSADEPTTTTTSNDYPANDGAAPVLEQDLLVEDVSIDGMCGVY
jgi:mycofactocin precursor